MIIANTKSEKILFPARGLNPDRCTPQQRIRAELLALSYPAEWIMSVPIPLFICRTAVIDCGGPGDCGLWFFSRIKKLSAELRRELVRGCTSGGYDQSETSSETIEQELRPGVCERGQTYGEL